MSNVILKNMPRLTLVDVLRRRKQTMKSFVDESGVQSYGGLCNLCIHLGMLPPDENTYTREVEPKIVNSPLDGLIVIEVGKEEPLEELSVCNETESELGLEQAEKTDFELHKKRKRKSKKEEKDKNERDDEV